MSSLYPHTLTNDQIRRLRLEGQRLSGSPPGLAAAGAQEIAGLARQVGGLQAQELRAARLGVRSRRAGLTDRAVEAARVEGRTIVRTWAMRGTLHLLATEDLPILLPLLGPRFIAADRRRSAGLGWDEAAAGRGLQVLRDTLAACGPLTRAELAAALAAAGLPAQGQAPIHLIARAALEGWLCLGPERAGKDTYVLLADWVELGKHPRTVEAARAELARRYLAAFGPAAPQDFAAWSGLPTGEARAAWGQIAGELVELEAAGGPLWLLKSQLDRLEDLQEKAAVRQAPEVRLLPRFDNYLLGYASRSLVVEPRHARRIHPGGGILHATLLVDGRAAGVWKTVLRRGVLEVQVDAFGELPEPALAPLDSEVADLGSFLGKPAKPVI